MPEARLYCLGVDPCPDQSSCVGMAEVVKADTGAFCCPGQLLEVVGEDRGVQGAPIWAGEDEAVVLVCLAQFHLIE